jgi:hypothetical protein
MRPSSPTRRLSARPWARAIFASSSDWPADLAQLAHLRQTFEELVEAYEGMRRMVERGYMSMPAPTANG